MSWWWSYYCYRIPYGHINGSILHAYHLESFESCKLHRAPYLSLCFLIYLLWLLLIILKTLLTLVFARPEANYHSPCWQVHTVLSKVTTMITKMTFPITICLNQSRYSSNIRFVTGIFNHKRICHTNIRWT